MAYPVLAERSTWFAPTVSTVSRSIITEIEIKDSYTPDSSVTIVDSWDASAAKDGSITCYVIGTKLIITGNGSGRIALNEDSSNWFQHDTPSWDDGANVESISGLSVLDTSNVRNFSYMFYYFEKIRTLDLSSFNTSFATNLSNMFFGCYELISLNISTWDTRKVTTTRSMFSYCRKLEYVNGLDDIDTSNVTDMSYMFQDAKVTNFQNLNTSKLEDMSYMFLGYKNESFVFPPFDLSNVTNFLCCFAGGPSGGTIKFMDLSNFNYPDGAKLEYFIYSEVLETLILPKGFGRSITDFSSMFQSMSRLKSIINVENMDVSDAEDFSFMFYGCPYLKEIDVSNWDVSKVTSFDHFAAHSGLKRKGIEKWNVSSAINMNAMFHNCGEEELDLSNWDVSKVQFFCQMFENSPNLKRVKGLEKWDTSSGLGFDEMFGRCYKLEEVDLSSFDTTKAKNGVSASGNGHTTITMYNMFKDCHNLKKVILGSKFSINGDGTNTAAANKLVLPTPSADYIEGADGMWYTINGTSYAPNGVKDKTSETYYASYDIVADIDVIVKNESLLDTARAIREISQDDDRYTPSQFGNKIRNIKVENNQVGLQVDENGNAILINTSLSVNADGEGTIGV